MKINHGKDRSPESIAFLTEIAEVCKKHNKVLAHEDNHGAFIVESLDFDPTCSWLMAAFEAV